MLDKSFSHGRDREGTGYCTVKITQEGTAPDKTLVVPAFTVLLLQFADSLCPSDHQIENRSHDVEPKDRHCPEPLGVTV